MKKGLKLMLLSNCPETSLINTFTYTIYKAKTGTFTVNCKNKQERPPFTLSAELHRLGDPLCLIRRYIENEDNQEDP
jgi:hypothetical protein